MSSFLSRALRPGQVAEIGEVVGPVAHIRRLQELGLRAGAILQMIRCGSPCILRVDGSTLCFREDDSLRVDGAFKAIGMTLVAAELAVGESGRIIRVVGANEVSRRLLEMGVTPGVEIRRLGTAPLGDPLEFELRGYRLSLRKSEAQQIEIDHRDTENTERKVKRYEG